MYVQEKSLEIFDPLAAPLAIQAPPTQSVTFDDIVCFVCVATYGTSGHVPPQPTTIFLVYFDLYKV